MRVILGRESAVSDMMEREGGKRERVRERREKGVRVI